MLKGNSRRARCAAVMILLGEVLASTKVEIYCIIPV
jgi:hypothetical protein